MTDMTTEVEQDIREQLRRELPSGIYEHTLRTIDVARELAAAHGVDPDRAELGALLHDVANGYSDGQLLTLAERYQIPVSLTEARVPKLLHGAVGAEILRGWGIDDEELLDAVRDHVSGSPHMSALAKILFIADKIEPGRDRHYGGLGDVREAAMRDLDEAMSMLYAWRITELVDAGRPVHERLVTSRNVLYERLRNRVFGA
jgi:predicted HD superfamily hydrolase involved in NAD metabolism